MPTIRLSHNGLTYDLKDPQVIVSEVDGRAYLKASFTNVANRRDYAGGMFTLDGISDARGVPVETPEDQHYDAVVNDPHAIAAVLKAAYESEGATIVAIEYVSRSGRRTIRDCTVQRITDNSVYVQQASDGGHRTFLRSGIQAVSV